MRVVLKIHTVKNNILENALEHLSQEPKMKQLIEEFGAPDFNGVNDYFNALSKSIIYQQLSGKAARTIYNRFLGLFDNNLPQPEDVIKIDIPTIRGIGLSQQKSNYISGLAEYFTNDGSTIDFESLSDIEVGDELMQIKGIGQWTVDMFLMFTLYRTDILPVADLGIQKGIKILFNMKNLPSKEYMIKKSKPWQPYRTLACWYLWRLVDDEIVW